MRRIVFLAAVLAAVLLPVGIVTAHSGTGKASVQVEPTAVDAGGTVDFAGTGLEPDNDRDLVLAGDGMVIDFGIVKTDANGMFSKVLTIPSHVPSGSYELRAIGDETLATTVQVTGAAAGSSAPAAGALETVAARSRPGWETGALLVLVAVILVAGGYLAWKAERLSRILRAPQG